MSLLSFTKKIAGQRDQKETAKTKRAATKTTATTDTPTPVSLAAGYINLTPLVTEKSVAAQAGANTVAFRVVAHATKGQVAAAIAERYQVVPRSIRSLKVKPKNRRRGNTYGQTNAWKKVYVTLPAGKTIDLSV